MGVVSTHSFVNHKGGVGKTTLTYQLSASYATAHPDCNVLIMDATDAEVTSDTNDEAEDSQSLINLEEYAIPLQYVNHRLPKNIYLCPSGLDIEHSIPFSDTQCHDIIDVLLDSFRRTESEWKIFVDTDAAAEGRSNVYTLIALGVSDFICLPLHADITDWYRVRPTLNDLHQLRSEDKSHARVHLVLWNGLSVQFKHEYRMGASVYSTFTPTKAEQDILACLNNLVFKEAQQFPDMFLYYEGVKTSSEHFGKQCCLCIRNFGAVGVASKDTGVPIAMLSGGLVHGMHTAFTLNESTISHCRENLEELVRAVDESNKLAEHFENGKEITSPAKSVKKAGRKKNKTSPSSKASDGVRYKTYSLRNKYPLRHRRKNASYNPYGEILLEISGTSTVAI
ncbi:hypothetical protein O6H91_07G019000 [Diphasiastrum complanatum]|uniref:Uncharacterized protein n=1 Tax=Diphasiastrum complanatum TaxID=34168 RepID=A0ACC2D309_DIPCM|nr:hypothetical protein O6H91_07G019000 [Diphasiastrum complanatum]